MDEAEEEVECGVSATPTRYFKYDTPHCTKVISGNGFSESNVQKHIKACKANPPKEKPQIAALLVC